MKITTEESDERLSRILGLTEEDLEERRKYIGASDANIILSGDDEKIRTLWLVKRGLQAPEDLSNVLAVQMGIWTERFNLHWYTRQTGNVITGNNTKIVHPAIPYLRATLDGKTTLKDGRTVVVDAKHVGPYNFSTEETTQRYAPQMAVQMACQDCPVAHISIFVGSNKWELVEIERDALYETQVLAAVKKFWMHVQDGTLPVDIPAVSVPMPAGLLRKVDFSANNAWVAAEQDYLTNEIPAKLFTDAKDALKGLILDDIGEVKGKSLKAKRDTKGAIRFSKMR